MFAWNRLFFSNFRLVRKFFTELTACAQAFSICENSVDRNQVLALQCDLTSQKNKKFAIRLVQHLKNCDDSIINIY